VDFDPRVRLEFRGTQLSSDGGLLVMSELDDALGLSDLASAALRDTRSGKNVERQPPCPRATTILAGFQAAEVGVLFGFSG